MFEIGAWPRALELARPIAAESHALAYLPFEAEAEYLQGRIEQGIGNRTEAEAVLEAAVWSAEAGRHDEIAARAWHRLIYLVGNDKAEFTRGLALVPRVTAALARLGGNAEIEADLEITIGGIDGLQGKLESTVAHATKAVALGERAFGPQHPKIAISLITLGSALENMGRTRQATPILQRAYDIRERALGPNHPDTAVALNALANSHNDSGEPARAEQELRRSLAIREASLGPHHASVVYNLGNLASALDDQGKSEEAVVVDARAVAVAEKAFGPEHPTFGLLLTDTAVHLRHADRLADASERLQRAEAILSKARGRDSFEMMFVRIARGDLLVRHSRWGEAAALYEQAIPALEKAQIVRSEVTISVINLGISALKLRQPARGLPALERLAQRLDDVRPDLRVAAEFTLARALWEAGSDRRRAHELATHALAAIRQIANARRDDMVHIEQWLAAH
jgi:tetratricopeptide (TPR) repeat protein